MLQPSPSITYLDTHALVRTRASAASEFVAIGTCELMVDFRTGRFQFVRCQIS